MAIIKSVNSRSSIAKAINYITKEEKTEQKLISGIDCIPESSIYEMKVTKAVWRKTEGRQYKHYIHSFSPEEKLTPELAHNMAREIFKDRFKGHEIIIATHKDKAHIHSHIIINSVNYINGFKLQQSKHDLQNIKEHSNKLSQKYGLTIAEKTNNITTNTQEKYRVLEKAIKGEYKSYLLDIAKIVTEVRKKSINKEDFIKKLQEKNIQTTWTDKRKYITFQDEDGHKVRNNNLEKTFKIDFTKEGLESEFQSNITRRRAEELLERSREYSFNKKNDKGNREPIIEKINATIRKSRNEISIDKSKRRDRISNEKGIRAKQHRNEKQQLNKNHDRGFGPKM